MNKQELIEQVSKTADLSKREAGEILDTVLDSIRRSVAKGDKVTLPGFGSFEKRARKARTARNPQTGATIKVPATSVPAFKAGKDFKDQVKGGAKKSAAKKKPAKKKR